MPTHCFRTVPIAYRVQFLDRIARTGYSPWVMSREGPSQAETKLRRDPLVERERLARLTEFYGALLTAHQREILQLCIEDDLSLAEIAAQVGVSRQAVHDLLRRSQHAMEALEERLGGIRRFEERQRDAERLQTILAWVKGHLPPGDVPLVVEAEQLLDRWADD